MEGYSPKSACASKDIPLWLTRFQRMIDGQSLATFAPWAKRNQTNGTQIFADNLAH
jgi:hypothetical protein